MGRVGNVLKFGDFSSGAVIHIVTGNTLRNQYVMAKGKKEKITQRF